MSNYQVDLAALQRLAEKNYVSLVRLLPTDSVRRIHVGDHLRFQLQVTQQSPYTTELKVEQQFLSKQSHSARLLEATMEVRLYHDARMAEVVKSQGVRAAKARYDQPNPAMLATDEKRQINRFLAEWLRLCLQQGRADQPWVPA